MRAASICAQYMGTVSGVPLALKVVATGFAGERKRVVVLGAGFGGAPCAAELVKRVGKDTEVVVLDRNNYTLYYPLLVEAGVGTLEPRHVTVPFRAQVPKADFRMSEVTGIDFDAKRVSYRLIGGAEESLRYDHLVFALGSITKVPDNIPGLKEYGFELKSLMDAIALRDRGIRLLEMANSLEKSEDRIALLTFVVVGANFTGVELAGEYHAFMQDAAKRYPHVRQDEIRMIVLEYGERILPGTTESLGKWCHDTLTKRGVDIRTKTTISEVGDGYTVATDGDRIPTQTVVWAAGIAPNPVVKAFGFPTNERGYIECERDLRVKGLDGVWAVGDSAFVPNPNGKPYAATAQNASRQGPLCARNIVATISGEGELKEFDFSPLGNFAAIGHKQAAAQVMGREFKGFLGWVLYRGAYLVKMPTTKFKLRLIGDWIGELLIPHEPVQLGVHEPHRVHAPDGPGDAERETAEIPHAFLK
jgi:NADH dehydrogenase